MEASEKKFTNIIPIGGDCQISFSLTKLNLRGASSIFEWHLINNFQEIVFAFENYLNGYPLEIEQRAEMPGNLFWKGIEIRTAHYTLEKYKCIYKRRWERLFLQILFGGPLLFIREDLVNQTNADDLEQFQKLIERINPRCIYKILLLSPPEFYSEIKMKNVNHRIIDGISLLQFIEEAAHPYFISFECSQKPNDDHD